MGDRADEIVWPTDGLHRAILDAAGTCMARWGVTKTTIADLAAEAGCSRATVYRLFPGGKAQIMATYGSCELGAFFATATRCVATSDSLDDALVAVITTAAQGLADHRGFQFMLAHEPGLVLPYLGFTNIDRLYGLVTEALAPPFERFVPGQATRLVDVTARITLSHIFQPSETIDLCDPTDVRRLVTRHLVPIVSGPAPSGPLPSVGASVHPIAGFTIPPNPAHQAVPA